MLAIEELLLPVSVRQPCGEDLSFGAELDAIAAARRQDDPSLEQGEWVTALREANWPLVAAQCEQLMRNRSKDLRLAAWLAEALAHTGSFRGLGDGFMLLSGLCLRYWEELHPLPEAGEQEQRIGNLAWLLAHTPGLVKQIPITEDGALTLAAFDAARLRGEVAELDARRRQNSADFNATLLRDAEYCLAALRSFQQAVDARLGSDGPAFSAAREALQHAIDFIGLLVPAAPDGAEPAAGMAPGAAGGAWAGAGGGAFGGAATGLVGGAAGRAGAGGALLTRAQALAQLRLVAEFFRRTEPHSPVAYLADKAAHWGELPLHEWLRLVVKDPAQSAQLDELLGAPPPA